MGVYGDNLILLGGNSFVHKSWIYEIETELGDLFERTYIHVYKHWEENGPIIDMDYESEKLRAVAKEFKEYVIFAKSAGILLALKGIKEGFLKPEKCVFVGMPFPWGRENGFDCDTWLLDYEIPTMFIQKSLDPAHSYKNVKRLLLEKRVKNCDLREIPGESHHYEDLTLLRELVESFLS